MICSSDNSRYHKNYEVFPYADALKVSHADLLGEIELALTGKRTIPPYFEYDVVALPDETDQD